MVTGGLALVGGLAGSPQAVQVGPFHHQPPGPPPTPFATPLVLHGKDQVMQTCLRCSWGKWAKSAAEVELCKHDPDAVPNGPRQQPSIVIRLGYHDPDAVFNGARQQSAAEMHTKWGYGQTAVCWSSDLT